MSRATDTTVPSPPPGIALWLDSYDDIFSDFDPRPYGQRALSDDFLAELRKLSREGDPGEFHLLLPQAKRDMDAETTIVKRLQAYFKKSHQRLSRQNAAARKKGWGYSFSGMALLLLAGYISFLHPKQAVLHLLMILCEPAGWFFVWIGYELLVNTPAKRKAESGFYAKMARSHIRFRSLPADSVK